MTTFSVKRRRRRRRRRRKELGKASRQREDDGGLRPDRRGGRGGVLARTISLLPKPRGRVNMHSLHGKVSVYRGACGRDGGTIGTFDFSKQSKQSEDFLNQRLKGVQNKLADRIMEPCTGSWAC
ncbi:unnamed protein product [Pleuronectes platessa]|uniref:Uncharacterized protein n=1 Tax=Pleuronectes platessa TaxID=8262 RepID=A0A9N7Y6V8_PLEPL|nr:unnamed protein product [Pleuronectes platessa]